MIPELLNLGDFPVAAASTQTGTPLVELNGMSRLALSARFAYGSGGTTVIAIIETSLNQGTTWIEIARFDFATTGLEKVMNLSADSVVSSPYTIIDLVAEGGVTGILGDRLRAVVTSTGTYTGSTLLALRGMAS